MDAIKALPREIFIALNAYIGEDEVSQINILNSTLRNLKKMSKIKLK